MTNPLTDAIRAALDQAQAQGDTVTADELRAVLREIEGRQKNEGAQP